MRGPDAVRPARRDPRLARVQQGQGLFDGLFSLEDADLIPKPDPRTFARMAARFGVAPASAAFFEDTVRNLEPAHALGMTTVLVGTRAHEADIPFVDHRAATLGPFLATARLPGDA